MKCIQNGFVEASVKQNVIFLTHCQEINEWMQQSLSSTNTH